MTPEQLRDRVDAIIAGLADYEAAHGREDALHMELIRAFCPEWVVREIDRLGKADFPRYCA